MARTTDRVVYFLLLMLWMTLPIARVCKPRLMGFVHTATARVACNEQSERKSRINVSRAAERRRKNPRWLQTCRGRSVHVNFSGIFFFLLTKIYALRVWYEVGGGRATTTMRKLKWEIDSWERAHRREEFESVVCKKRKRWKWDGKKWLKIENEKNVSRWK